MRRLHLALAALVAGAALLVAGASASIRSITRIQWNAKFGAPYLVVTPGSVWVNAVTIQGSSTLWRVDRKQATASPTPVTALLDGVYAGQGSLWVSDINDAGDHLGVDWVDVRHGYRLVPKVAPRTCEIGDGGHSVVYGGRLWFACARSGVFVFTPHHPTPAELIRERNVVALLPTARGLWLVTATRLQAIAGPDKGAVIDRPRPFVVAGDYASNVGWAVAGSTAWAIGTAAGHPELVRFDLEQRTATAYPIVVPGGGYLGGGIAIARNEVWFGDAPHARLIRYSQSDPNEPLGYIRLPGHGIVKDGYLSVQSGAGAAWVEVERPNGLHLWRLSTH